MKILAFSDLHLDIAARDAVLAAAEGADLVIGAGDFASRRAIFSAAISMTIGVRVVGSGRPR